MIKTKHIIAVLLILLLPVIGINLYTGNKNIYDPTLRNIYDVYPVGYKLKKEDLKFMQTIYFLDDNNFALKIDFARVRDREIFTTWPHLLLFDSTLTLKAASYFPFTVDSVVNNTFHCKHWGKKDWTKQNSDFPRDLPDSIQLSVRNKEHHDHPGFPEITLKRLDVSHLPFISLSFSDNGNRTVTAPIDRFEFTFFDDVGTSGKLGKIQIEHKEKMFSPRYHTYGHMTFYIYNRKLITQLYDGIWNKLQPDTNYLNKDYSHGLYENLQEYIWGIYE